MGYGSQAAYDAAEPDDFERDERAEADFNEPDSDESDDYAADMAEGRWTEGRGL